MYLEKFSNWLETKLVHFYERPILVSRIAVCLKDVFSVHIASIVHAVNCIIMRSHKLQNLKIYDMFVCNLLNSLVFKRTRRTIKYNLLQVKLPKWGQYYSKLLHKAGNWACTSCVRSIILSCFAISDFCCSIQLLFIAT